MPFLSFYRKAQIGLDIQPDAIRFAQLSKRRQRYRIHQLASHVLPPGIFVDGKIKQWDTLQWQLMALGEKYHWQGVAAGIALPINLVRMQQIQLPAGLSDSEMETQVYLHIQRDLPMTDTLCADFTAVASQIDNRVDVHFTAARQEYVSQYTACVAASGLQVKLMDVDVYAKQRAESVQFEWQHEVFDLTQASEYLLALGLAMREMPAW